MLRWRLTGQQLFLGVLGLDVGLRGHKCQSGGSSLEVGSSVSVCLRSARCGPVTLAFRCSKVVATSYNHCSARNQRMKSRMLKQASALEVLLCQPSTIDSKVRLVIHVTAALKPWCEDPFS